MKTRIGEQAMRTWREQIRNIQIPPWVAVVVIVVVLLAGGLYFYQNSGGPGSRQAMDMEAAIKASVAKGSAPGTAAPPTSGGAPGAANTPSSTNSGLLGPGAGLTQPPSAPGPGGN